MSDQWFSVIMVAVMLPVILVMAALLANETKPKKNIILGVTLPFAARYDGQVEALCAGFRKKLWLMTVPLCLLCAPMFFVPWFSVQLTWYMVWIIIVIVAPYVLYVRTYLRLKAIKREREWYPRRSAQVTTVDITAAAAPRKPLSAWWFIPALLLSLVPVILALTVYSGERGMDAWLILGLSFSAMVLLSWAIYPLIFRLRTDVAGEDSTRNTALTNVRRAAWGRAWISIAWSTALCGVAAFFCRSSELGQLIVIIIYTFVLLRLCVWTEMGLRRAQEKLTDVSTDDYIDEDEHWIWGVFYNNPNDSHLTVNDRTGMNVSFNLAKPAGKLIMGACALMIAAMPLIGVWMMGVEFSPRRVEVTESAVEVVHLTRQFTVSLDEAESVELIGELPQTYRTNGTGMDGLQEGHFSVDGYGKCRLCLDPRESPFIVLTAAGVTYIFNAETPEETEDVFNTIRSDLSA